MDTNLSLSAIELSLMRYFQSPQVNSAICNISYGLLNHEVDVCILSKSHYLTEIEIKRSYADFLADFKKNHHHDDDVRVKNFYYCVPESIKDKVMTKLKEKVEDRTLKQLPAVLTYDENGSLKIIEESGNPTIQFHKALPLTKEEVMQFYRLGVMRLYNFQEKNLNLSRDYHWLYKKYTESVAIDKIRIKRKDIYKKEENLINQKSELFRKQRLLNEGDEKNQINKEIIEIEKELEYYRGKLEAYFEIAMI